MLLKMAIYRRNVYDGTNLCMNFISVMCICWYSCMNESHALFFPPHSVPVTIHAQRYTLTKVKVK
jgi:hypothetical protein